MGGFEFGAILHGLEDVTKSFEKVQARTELANKRIVQEVAAEVEKAAKANFQGSHKPHEPHTGGNRPNVVSGSLRRSIHPDPATSDGRGYSIRLGPRMAYSRAIEWGNPRTHGRAFPYFRPAVDQVRPHMRSIAREAWTRSTRP